MAAAYLAKNKKIRKLVDKYQKKLLMKYQKILMGFV